MKIDGLTAKELIEWRKNLLIKGGRSVDLDWLLDFSGGISWSSLQKLSFDGSEKVILSRPLIELEDLWHKYLYENVPLQYLVGRCPWRDFELQINAQALIPRPETELMIDLALMRVNEKATGRWADLGTGSGAIAIALARALPNWKGHAVDCSSEALSLAKKNISFLVPQAQCLMHLGCWWNPLKPWCGCFNLVIANPPYIPELLIDSLDPCVKDHEPLIALNGGKDGLQSIRQIINGSMNYLVSGGLLILEHHYDQSEIVLKMIEDIGFKDCFAEVDLNGIKRFAIATNP